MLIFIVLIGEVTLYLVMVYLDLKNMAISVHRMAISVHRILMARTGLSRP